MKVYCIMFGDIPLAVFSSKQECINHINTNPTMKTFDVLKIIKFDSQYYTKLYSPI